MPAAEPRLPFRDRREAGRVLARRLLGYRAHPDTVVLGLPRGGVIPASEVALALRLPLDLVIARKLGAPGNPELAIGAVAEGGEPYLDTQAVALTAASPDYVQAEVARQRTEILRRQRRYRHGRGLVLPPRATVLLVDDGVATGATTIAAIRALRGLGVGRLVVALAVAPPDTAAMLATMADELVVLATPAAFYAVGQFYLDFRQVSDEEVERLLAAAARAEGGAASGDPP